MHHLARPLDDAELAGAGCRRASAFAGLAAQVRLFRSGHVSSPITWGTLRPTVVLPAIAMTWPRSRRLAVLSHELAHTERADSATQLAGLLACAFHWFNPLAWLAWRGLRRESERGVRRPRAVARDPGHRVCAAPARHRPAGPRDATGRHDRDRHGASLAPRGTAARDPGPIEVALESIESRPVRDMGVAPPPGLAVRGLYARSPGAAQESAPVRHARLDLREDRSRACRRTPGAEPRDRRGRRDHGLGRELGQRARPPRRPLSGRKRRSRLHNGMGTWSSPCSRTFGAARAPPRTSFASGSRIGTTFTSIPLAGDLTINDLEGALSGETGGGEITIGRAKGRASLSTGGGDILIRNSSLDGHVSTGGGAVRFQEVTEDIKGSSGKRTGGPRRP